MKKFVTYEFSGILEIEVDAKDDAEAEKKSFEVIEKLNHTHVPGFGYFEYHDGEVVDVDNKHK